MIAGLRGGEWLDTWIEAAFRCGCSSSVGNAVPINVWQSDKTCAESASQRSATGPAVGLRQRVRRFIMTWSRSPITISTYRVECVGKLWNRKSASNLDGVALLTADIPDTTHDAMFTSSPPLPMDNPPSTLHPHTGCRPSLSPHCLVCMRNPPASVLRKLRPFCSPDDTSSCTHYQQNQTWSARQKIFRPNFRKASTLFTGSLTQTSGFT